MGSAANTFTVEETTIETVLDAFSAGTLTSTQLTESYLARIEEFDRGAHGLNSIVVRNPEALAQAAESDERLKAGTARALEGIPFTVKDSYMVRGLTVASGSPAFEHLVAQWDSFAVQQLRAAGAVLIGKTNMPPMAAGGMQRGVYGRAESPYNREYLAAAYASGSSNGSGVATAANFAVFGMAEETVSSGRSPASNNGLCAYTPSWGLISIRGNWPLFPARDVVVPHTRSIPDLLRVLDVLVHKDPLTRGDFWRNQTVVPLPNPEEARPHSYLELADAHALHGKRFAVPQLYLNEDPAHPITLRPTVMKRFEAACARLESLGAELVRCPFPLIEQYEAASRSPNSPQSLGYLPPNWVHAELGFSSFAWNDFLEANGDPQFPGLHSVDPTLIFPQPPGTLPDRYEPTAPEATDTPDQSAPALNLGDPREHPDFAAGLTAVVRMREELFEQWLDEHGFDGIVFPAKGDVGHESAERDLAAADHAWQNGVWFSNGNYALRHLGIPTVTVAMGVMEDIGMPVGLTFAGRAYDDARLLSFGYAFEHGGGEGTMRVAPSLASSLPSSVSATPHGSAQ